MWSQCTGQERACQPPSLSDYPGDIFQMLLKCSILSLIKGKGSGVKQSQTICNLITKANSSQNLYCQTKKETEKCRNKGTERSREEKNNNEK